MEKLQLFLQLNPHEEPRLGICLDPAWLEFSQKERSYIYILTPSLPADQLIIYYQRGCQSLSHWKYLWKRLPWPQVALYLIQRQLQLKYLGFPLSLAEISSTQWRLDIEQRQQLFNDLNQLLAGHLLPTKAILQEMRQQGWWPADTLRGLATSFASGFYQLLPGIVYKPWGELRCNRCNSTDVAERFCLECGRVNCPVCLSCEALGAIRGCTCLWYIADQKQVERILSIKLEKPPKLTLKYSLTPAQQHASQRLIDFLDSEQQQIQVWAACGAGKTEVTFGAIQRILTRGEQVLFAIPRRDIVQELAERLRQAFPDTTIAAHYGGQPWRQPGQLVIATTHQALRFYHRFGLVVLDEVDAFPYDGSEELRFAVERARKPDGKLIEMTATPKKLSKNLITIPARHHGYPLPEPRLYKLKLPPLAALGQTSLPSEVAAIIQRNSAPWLVFAPTVASVQQIAQLLSIMLDRSVCGSWAADPLRDQKRHEFISGNYQVLVATSIMERGITISNVQVMVLYADHHVFDVNSLVQMAGRVGRKAEHPEGEVWFIAEKISEPMKLAQERIRYLNQQAHAQGLLRERCFHVAD